MKKLLSLALILSLLLSCGVFASPDAVVSESADEALAEVSGGEETAELAMEETVINYDFSKITEVPSGISVPANWNPTITGGALQITSPAAWNYGAVVSFVLEDGATYKISAKIKSNAANSFFLVGAGSKQDTTNKLIQWTKATTTTITDKTYTVNSNNFSGASLYNGGLYLGGGKVTTYDIYSLKVVKIVNQIDVPYSLKEDSDFNISKLPSNFGRFSSADYTAEIKDGVINIAAAGGYPCVGFGLNLQDGETYKVQISGTTDNTTNVYFILLAGGVQTKTPLATITSKTFSYDLTVTLDSSIFKAGYDANNLDSNTGFALTCNKATNFTISDFSVTKVQKAETEKKTFTADNENVFTNGGFEDEGFELASVVDTTAAVSKVNDAKDGSYALKVEPGVNNPWVNIGTNVEWQIDRKYRYSFDIKVLSFANGTEVTSGKADLRSLVNFTDANATKGSQHSDYINSALAVGEWQHIEGIIDLDAVTSNGGKGIASDADLSDGVFAFFFIPVNGQNYNYIIDNISLVRLPYETDVDISFDFDNADAKLGSPWVITGNANVVAAETVDSAAETAIKDKGEHGKVLKVTQNTGWAPAAFHMPLTKGYAYTISYDMYVVPKSTETTVAAGHNFIFADSKANGGMHHGSLPTRAVDQWVHVEETFNLSGAAEDANFGQNYLGFMVSTNKAYTFYIDNLEVKSYAPWNDDIAAEYAPVSNTETFSVRADENSGIRTFASVTHEQRGGCTEYGFIVALTDTLAANGNEELTFESKSKFVSGVSYGQDNGTKVDKIYRADGDKTIFAAVFTGITEANYTKALTFRPYLKVNYPNGGEKVVYGEAISKSVYDVVLLLNNADSIAGMTKAQIEFCKKVIPSFGE